MTPSRQFETRMKRFENLLNEATDREIAVDLFLSLMRKGEAVISETMNVLSEFEGSLTPKKIARLEKARRARPVDV